MKKENVTWYSLRKVKGGLASLTLVIGLWAGAVTASADDFSTGGNDASTVQEQVLSSSQSDKSTIAQASSETVNASTASDAVTVQDSQALTDSSASADEASPVLEHTEPGQESEAQTNEADLLAESKVSADGTVSAVLGAVNPTAQLTGFHEGPDGSWYYYGADGQPVTGAQTINGQNLFFAADGKQVKGAFATNATGQRYFYDADTGERWSNRFVGNAGNWYYLGADGQPVTGAQQVNGQNLYFNADGSQVKGQLANRDGFSYYYASDTGDLVTNTTVSIDGKTYRLNEFGVATTDQDKIATVQTTMVLDS